MVPRCELDQFSHVTEIAFLIRNRPFGGIWEHRTKQSSQIRHGCGGALRVLAASEQSSRRKKKGAFLQPPKRTGKRRANGRAICYSAAQPSTVRGEMEMHIFTELVGLQMILMNALDPILRGETRTPDQVANLFRQVQTTKAARAQELLTKRSQKKETT